MPAAIEIAQKNIRSAGLVKYIDLKTLPFQQYADAPQPGILVTNPPYGERISSRDLLGLYTMIGERIKHVFTGYKVWILSYKDECFDKIGLRPSEKMKLINGSLDCEYRCYDIFEGKNKDYKKTLSEEGGEAPSDSRPKTEFPRKEYGSRNNNRPARRPDFKSDRMDSPARRFAAAHSEDDDERVAAAPGKRFFGEDRNDGRPARKQFGGERGDKRPDRKSFGDKKPFGDRKSFGDRSERPDRKPFGERPVKMRYKEEGKSGDRKKFGDDRRRFNDRPDKRNFGDSSFKKTLKKRDDDSED